MDFIQIIDRIFINRKHYHEISDEDKINAFFIINRKLGKHFPEISKQLNHRCIDKASAVDMWYEHFNGSTKIPGWYWDPKDREKKTKSTKKNNYSVVQEREELKDFEMKYLELHFENDLKNEMKKINKFDNE